MSKVVIVSALRAPIGKIPGELTYINEIQLLAKVFKSVTHDFENINIDEAITGSSFPIERDNLCRKAVTVAGLSSKISASTVSKTCASSDEALSIAFNKISSDSANVVLVGGSEKISNSSYTLHFMKNNIKKSVKKNIPNFDNICNSILENDMTYICEMLSRKHNITRKMQDDFTIQSIRKAIEANDKGKFSHEIVPIKYEKDNQSHYLNVDEMLTLERREEDICNASPMFIKDGTLTQYNSATMCDCATAMVVMKTQLLVDLNLNPLVGICAIESTGVENSNIGHAMETCVTSILKKNGLHKNDIDVFEINESFAVQALSVINSLEIDADKVNVNGGSLALGYPIGATGMRMNITLIHEMLRKKSKYGLSVMCAGGNMAQAIIFERV